MVFLEKGIDPIYQINEIEMYFKNQLFEEYEWNYWDHNHDNTHKKYLWDKVVDAYLKMKNRFFVKKYFERQKLTHLINFKNI
jgi:hypothetical protein